MTLPGIECYSQTTGKHSNHDVNGQEIKDFKYFFICLICGIFKKFSPLSYLNLMIEFF